MVEKNKKPSIQQDVSTEEQEPLTDLKSMRLDLLCKIDLLLGRFYALQNEIDPLLMERDSINDELLETFEFISEEILIKYNKSDIF